jgi:hypothetical protein
MGMAMFSRTDGSIGSGTGKGKLQSWKKGQDGGRVMVII